MAPAMIKRITSPKMTLPNPDDGGRWPVRPGPPLCPSGVSRSKLSSTLITSSQNRVIGPSGHRVIRSSGHWVIGSSGHRVIGPSGHRVIGPSGHRVIGPSGHRAIGSSGDLEIGRTAVIHLIFRSPDDPITRWPD